MASCSTCDDSPDPQLDCSLCGYKGIPQMPITKPFIQFLNEVEDLKIAMRWRDGQALFNHLYAISRNLAEEIRFVGLDPFFLRKEDEGYKKALKWLKEKWNE